ncbi:hypothetical protein, partial [Rathayibacter sp. AY1B8]|uniref:hypothetical protein n=1 Tax=Rathayibacter sp. AY1B8 TaxID=2080533 RepID=UPI0011B07411
MRRRRCATAAGSRADRAAGPAVEGAPPRLIAALSPDKVKGTIVACTAGVTARVSKSAEVERAGGIG